MTVVPFPMPNSDDDDNPRARNTDPDTSHIGGKRGPNWEAIEHKMLRIYTKALIEERLLADDEVMDECGWGMEKDGHRRRCSDLRKPRMVKGVMVRPPLIVQGKNPDGTPAKHISRHTEKPRIACVLNAEGIEYVRNKGILREVLNELRQQQ